MRIVKDPIERRNEILDCAEMLFGSKGYTKTTINDVLTTLNIAKGTFYYYFKSKEELMEAVVIRFIDEGVAAARSVSENQNLSATEKMRMIIAGDKTENKRKDVAVEQFHQSGNAEMHQKSLVETVRRLTPVMGDIVRQGIKEGVFHTPYPEETMEFLLTASQFLLDEGLFNWSGRELVEKAKAFSKIMELLLGAEPGTFDYVYTRYEEMLRHHGDLN